MVPISIDVIIVILFVFILLNLDRYFFGVPFVRSTDEQASTILKLLKPAKGERIADLGSGDGILLISIAQAGALSEGFETSPILVWKSRRKIKKLGLAEKVTIYRKSYWEEDLSSYDAITIYGVDSVMGRLERKLLAELKPGTRVVSSKYKFPHWKPAKEEGKVYLYVKSREESLSLSSD